MDSSSFLDLRVTPIVEKHSSETPSHNNIEDTLKALHVVRRVSCKVLPKKLLLTAIDITLHFTQSAKRWHD